MGETTIQWTNESWNPIRGCSRVDDDCINCYAEGVAARFSGLHPKTGKPLAYHGLARRSSKGLPLWTGEVRMIPEHFADPIRWTRPRRIFVNSMSDLFHEELTNEQIAAVFGVMASAPHHTFQVLTKRAKRMREWFQWVDAQEPNGAPDHLSAPVSVCALAALRTVSAGKHFLEAAADPIGRSIARVGAMAPAWPLENVHLGVSAGFQRVADERIPYLMQCPAAVHWVSAEPLIGPIDFGHWLRCPLPDDTGYCIECKSDSPTQLDWVVVGGESGLRARSFDLDWGRSIVKQCRRAGTPVFVKQLGRRPIWDPEWEDWWKGPHVNADGSPRFADSHGGDMTEWPEDLRVREFPR